MTDSLEQLLEERSSYPSGDAHDWRERYRPLVDEVVRHRDTDDARISVVIVAWHSAEFVVECIDHVLDQRGLGRNEVEVILVDNGGLDSVRDEIAARVDLELRMAGNVRLCRARNAGTAWASTSFVANIDDDGLIEDDYLQTALRYFENPDIVALRSRIVAKDHPFYTTLAYHYDRGEWPVEDCLVTEGSSVLRRDPFIEAGGFAEALSGHEGVELTFRLKQQNPDASVLYVPEMVMHHDYFDSWEKFYRKAFYYAGIDDSTADRDPKLAEFMDEYFSRHYDRSPRPLHEEVARIGLEALRSVLKLAARVRYDVASPMT